MIYLFDQLESITDEYLEKIIRVLPLERRKKVRAFKFSIDQIQSAIGYMLLLYGLRLEYGIFEELAFSYGKNGKPYLKNYPNIYFNISHCKVGVVCAISDNEVGIDIEKVEAFDLELGKYCCSPEELDRILSSNSPEAEFYSLWTKKESFLKLTGEGLNTDLKGLFNQMEEVPHFLSGGTFSSHQIKEDVFQPHKAYMISICTWETDK
ncbi:MAG: hypothetical protein CVV02_00010 [Firmicutes bacterium HGW-Firmicutes-7]|nr:MAG: hypothetical protein CVV02_00010 [Firmicutes bacterium HGW-Firmicutes-7]